MCPKSLQFFQSLHFFFITQFSRNTKFADIEKHKNVIVCYEHKQKFQARSAFVPKK